MAAHGRHCLAARSLALVTALALSGCSISSDLDRRTTPFVFGACAETSSWATAPLPVQRPDRLEVSCATLTVPIDHADPARGSLDVAVTRVRATNQQQRIGSLILNPGGPGVSGVDYMPSWLTWLPDELLARFDLVSFDPRGTGRSAPIRCQDRNVETVALPDLRTDTGWAAATLLLRARAQACADALGERARLLDGPPAPLAAWSTVVESQIAGFEAAFASYANQCQARETCATIGDVRRLFDHVVTKARTTPIPSGRPAGDRPATWDVVTRSVLGFLPAPESWRFLDTALAEAGGGDSGSLYDMIDSLEGRTPANPDADTDDAASVILCNDIPPGAALDHRRADAARLARDYPIFGEYGAWWLFACSYWPVPHQALPATPLTVAAPVLVVGTRSDPSTPYSGALEFTRSIGPRAVLLTRSGAGHTAFGRSPCIGEHVTAYLVAMRTPPPGTVCS